jgi:hypothetical protein
MMIACVGRSSLVEDQIHDDKHDYRHAQHPADEVLGHQVLPIATAAMLMLNLFTLFLG